MAREYYFTETDQGFRLKERGNTQVLGMVDTIEEARLLAQYTMTKEEATFRIQDMSGKWFVV